MSDLERDLARQAQATARSEAPSDEADREPSGSAPSELEQISAAPQLPQQSADSNARIEAALERRLANGRESQRRFRERQKVFETHRSAVVAVE